MKKIESKILLKPSFLLPLTLLLLNDHLLKAAYPGWLTGKLSDFAGLFVLAVFAYAVVGRYFESPKRLIAMHIAIGLGFVIWKAAPVEIIFAGINRFVSMPLPSRVKDISDLIALSILPVSYLYISRNRRQARKPTFPVRGVLKNPHLCHCESRDSGMKPSGTSVQSGCLPRNKLQIASSSFGLLAMTNLKVFQQTLRFRQICTICVLAITGLAIVATAPGRRYDLRPNVSAETDRQYQELLKLFEHTLTEKGIAVKDKHAVDDTTYRYKIDFKEKNPESSDIKEKPDNWYVSFITLVYSPTNQQISIQSIYGWVTEALPEDKKLNRFYMEKLIDPFLDKVK